MHPLVAALIAALALVAAACAGDDGGATPTTQPGVPPPSSTTTTSSHPIDPPELACQPEFMGLGNDDVLAEPPPEELRDAMSIVTVLRGWPALSPDAPSSVGTGDIVTSVDPRVRYAQTQDRLWAELDGEWVAYTTLGWLDEGESQGWGSGAGPGWGYPGGSVESTECPPWTDLQRALARAAEEAPDPRSLSCGAGSSERTMPDLERARFPEPELGRAITLLIERQRSWPALLDPADAEPDVELASVDDRVTYEQADGSLWIRLDGERMVVETLAWIDDDEPSSIEPDRSGWGAPDARTEHRECPDWRLFDVHRSMGEGADDDREPVSG